MDVKILTYTSAIPLEKQIEKWTGFDYKLVGPVTIGQNDHGNMVYVATMVKEDEE